VQDQGAALRAVTAAGFDPSARVVLEGDPGIAPSPGQGGHAAYVQLTPDSARVEVTAPAPSIVLLRDGYDAGWRATVDGKPAAVLAADYLVQAVAVPRGRHIILLSYHDARVGEGLLGSGVVIAGILVAAGALAVRSRRRRRSAARTGQSLAVQNGEPSGGSGPPVNVVTR
jgi:hypothetical protein